MSTSLTKSTYLRNSSCFESVTVLKLKLFAMMVRLETSNFYCWSSGEFSKGIFFWGYYVYMSSSISSDNECDVNCSLVGYMISLNYICYSS